jgi:hypothetical protein
VHGYKRITLHYFTNHVSIFLFVNLIIYHSLNFIFNVNNFQYIRYLHRRCIELGNNDIYRFIDLHFTHNQNEWHSVQSYIEKKLCDDKKNGYLAPYFNNNFFILVIIFNHL